MISKTLQFSLLLLAAYLFSPAFSQRDYTYEDRGNGKDVTEAVLRRTANSELPIFPDDHSFFIRLAYVESRFGTHNATFRANYTGGIWQVDEAYFNKTLSPSLTAYHNAITSKFDLRWKDVKWASCLAPMYSGLAAALYFAQLPEHIPDKISEQAAHWKKYYRPNGNMNDFIEAANELRNETVCRGKMDLVIVLDGSGSVGLINFERAKNFVATMIESFTLDFTRIGMLTYSNAVTNIFHLRDNLTIPVMARRARSALYPTGGTNTDAAILRAVKMHNETTRIDGVPQIVAVLTDGKNTGSNLPGAVNEMSKNELLPIAVGITREVNLDELKFIALNDSRRVFTVSDFEALQDFLYELTSITCEIPQKPIVNGSYEDALVAKERRLYEINVSVLGITINITVTVGKTVGFWSRRDRVPNSAVHDGVINGPTFIPPAARNGIFQDDGPVYISIEGVETMNNYTFEAVDGNQVPKESGAAKTLVSVVLFIFTTLYSMSML